MNTIEDHLEHLRAMPRQAYCVVAHDIAGKIAEHSPIRTQGYSFSVKVRDLGYGQSRVSLEQMP